MKRAARLAICLMVMCSATVSADEVVFKSGERLAGTIERLVGGKLTIASEAAGSVTVDLVKVATFSTDAPIEIHFEDGTVTCQKVEAAESGRISTAGTDVVAAQSFAVDSIVAINPPKKAPAEWTGNVTAGYTLTRGNSETETANIDVSLARRAENDRITLNAVYLFSAQENPDTGDEKTTQDKWYGALKYDYFVSKKTYVFGNGRVERNRIAELDNRLTLGGGMGYQWLESETFNLGTEVGIAWLYEKYDTEDDSENEFSVQLGYHLDKQLNDHVTFLHNLTYYPAFSDPSDCFLTTQAELRAALTKSLFGSFKVALDYDSTPAAGAKKTDLAYILGVGLKLF